MTTIDLSINLNDWNLSTTKFVNWVLENKLDVYAINTSGGNGSRIFVFDNLEDITAFKLTFGKDNTFYRGEMDTGYYYAPYIPLLKI